mgnify:FL=1
MPVLEPSHTPDPIPAEDILQDTNDYTTPEHTTPSDSIDRYEAETYYTQPEPPSLPQDVNSIQITISDKQTPLVLLVGPPACGKTMTLIRLARYLKEKGYQLEPVRTLRPSTDKAYLDLCNNFNSMLSTPLAAEATNLISFMLVRVLDKGKVICQILEAPGEHYFNPNDPHSPFPTYLNQVFADRMRKIWTFIVEKDWRDEQNRLDYVQRIREFQLQIHPRDRALFLFNKIDLTKFVIGRGRVNRSAAKKDVEDSYPGIFEPFRNTHPITSLWKPWRCEFLPFQTGTYTVNNRNGQLYFQAGADDYPAALWQYLLHYIRG